MVDWSKHDFSGMSKRERYKEKKKILKSQPDYEKKTVISSEKAAYLGISEEQKHNLTETDLAKATAEKPGYKESKPQEQSEVEAFVEAENAKIANQEPTSMETPIEAPIIAVDNREETGLQALVKEDTLLGKAAAIASSTKTTMALATILATAVTAGSLTAAGTAVMTRSASGAIVKKVVTNPKAVRLVTSYVSKVAAQFKKPKLVAGIVTGLIASSVGGKVFGQFVGQEEASQTVNIAARDALVSGNMEAYEDAAKERDELLQDNTFWEEVQTWIPGKNVYDGLQKYREAAIVASAVFDKIAADKLAQQETEGEETEKWARIREEEAEAQKEKVDYYNSERQKLLEWEREAEEDARNEDAAFWRKEREKQFEMEAKDREAIAKFWQAYRKESQKISDSQRPSNLNFGLI